MRPECINAVTQAIGRQLSKAELDAIEERLVRHMRALKQSDPVAWQGKSNADRLNEAAATAASEMIHASELNKKRLALTIVARQRISAHLEDQAAKGIDGLDALDRVSVFHADHKSNFLSIESTTRAIRNDALRQMIGTLEASNPKWFGLFENKEGVEAIIKEIFGEDTGNVSAKSGAKLWGLITSKLRERFNRAGGDIGELMDWGMPHHHSQSRVAAAGKEAWVNDIRSKLDTKAYFNPDGSPMSADRLTEFLNNAWLTIASGGANKVSAGEFRGNGSRANRGNASRQLHFKDAQSYIDYQKKFGDKSLYEILVGHIENISKDIALTETLGPNPDNLFKYFKEDVVNKAKTDDPTKYGDISKRAIRSENYYNEVSGKTLPVASRLLAESFDTLRNWLIASRLGSAIITSFSDEGTLYLTAKLNGLSMMRVLANELDTMNIANKVEERMAQRAGLSLNTLLSSLNRFGQDGLKASFSKKLANSVLRVSGLNAITEARKRAFGVTMMGGIGGVVKDHASLKDLTPSDHRMLLSKGISEADFQVWKKAQQEDWGGGNDTMLTPESIYRIPDADIDSVISPTHAKIRAEAQAHIDELSKRNSQDAQWLANRSQNISRWLQDQQTKISQRLADKGAKIDADTQAALSRISEKMSNLQEQVTLAESSWMTPEDENTPGIDSAEKVSFYGKNKLRKLGKSEGGAREALKTLKKSANEILASADQLKEKNKSKLMDDLFDGFNNRRADLAEFAQRANDRMDRRTQVADRIAKQVDPALDAARTQAREQAATKLLAHILEETDVAVIEPGALERSRTSFGLQRGTMRGELTRSFFLFKSFPLAMMTRHFVRMLSQPTGTGKAAYFAALLATTTVGGLASLQISELLSGRDPRNLNLFAKAGWRNWIAAMLKGGSLGIYGDFLFSDNTQYGQSPIASLAGPLTGELEDLFNLTQGNILHAFEGQKTHFGAQAVKFVKGNVPGASLWYAKAAFDHMIFQRLQEYFSPGYLAHMRERAEREFGQHYWWSPGQPLPERAPNLPAVVGE